MSNHNISNVGNISGSNTTVSTTGNLTLTSGGTIVAGVDLDMSNHNIINLNTLNAHNLYQYGQWASTDNNTLISNTPRPITWDIGVLAAGFSPASGGTYLTAALAGNYKIATNLILTKGAGGGSSSACYLWVETTGGVQVANSCRHIDLPTSTSLEIALTFILPLTAGQAFRIMVASDGVNVTQTTIPAQTTPYPRPQVPTGNLSVFIVS
jgi:hypothetical protein